MKKKYLQFFIITFLFNICINHGIYAQANDTRIKNIEAAFPVIDEIFSSYARQNHFPGFVYGLIVDGKLIHKGNIGYSPMPSHGSI